MGGDLWSSTDGQRWLRARRGYATAVRVVAASKYTKSKDPERDRKAFLDLDAWYSHREVGRRDVFTVPLTAQKLARVAKWKLSKGTFRPGLLQKVESNTAGLVARTWKELSDKRKRGPKDGGALGRVLLAMRTLDKRLHGVGPATASAVLAPLCEACAFMSDEAMLGCRLFKDARQLKYDHKTFERFLHLMHEKANVLGRGKWVPDDIQRALFAEAVRLRVAPQQWKDAEAGPRRVMKRPAARSSDASAPTISKRRKR